MAHDVTSEVLESLRRAYPMRPSHSQASGRAILTRAVAEIPDVLEDPEYRVNLAAGRSLLAVPMLRADGSPIGTIVVQRSTPGRFAPGHVDMLRTFADQAVIAIENVRLFAELQETTRAATEAHARVSEALEQQTATSEILRVISSSPTDAQPVFDAIVRSAVRLCDGCFGIAVRHDDDQLSLVAHHNVPAQGLETFAQSYPAAPSTETVAGRAVLRREVVHVPDVMAEDADVSAGSRQRFAAVGYRAILGVPMLRNGLPIGAINISRREPRPFTDTQIELVKTFADQAVIAIENVRLFTELQTSNRDLTTALDKQTATSDILRVISRSQTDVQPVFDAILTSAVRLLGGFSGVLTRVAGEQIGLAAFTNTDDAGDAAVRATYPLSLQSENAMAQAIRDRAPVNIADAQTDPRSTEALRATARVRGRRSLVVVPMLRHDEAIGTIAVTRREPGGFNDDEIALLQTFADQAVIAIENARLLSELQASNLELTTALDQQTATSEILRAISGAHADPQPVYDAIAHSAMRLCGARTGAVHRFDGARPSSSRWPACSSARRRRSSPRSCARVPSRARACRPGPFSIG